MDISDKNFVFTGILSAMKRQEAIRLVEERLGIVQPCVTKTTDYLIIGHRQLSMFENEKISRKRLTADALIKEGGHIKILGEDDFMKLVNSTI